MTGTIATVGDASQSSLKSQMSQDFRADIEATAQAILDARARYPDSSKNLYHSTRKTENSGHQLQSKETQHRPADHRTGVRDPETPEPEIVAHLFKLYAEKVNLQTSRVLTKSRKKYDI